jgi:hypothetical protein
MLTNATMRFRSRPSGGRDTNSQRIAQIIRTLANHHRGPVLIHLRQPNLQAGRAQVPTYWDIWLFREGQIRLEMGGRRRYAVWSSFDI